MESARADAVVASSKNAGHGFPLPLAAVCCPARMSSIVSQAKVNLHNICCGNGCHLTEECWLRCGPGDILLLQVV